MKGVYIIQSISNPSKVYVGSSFNIERRWYDHRICLKLNKHHSGKLQNHYNKYGKDDLVFEVIESGEYLDKNHLLSREQGWFSHFGYKYNDIPFFCILEIAGSALGYKRGSPSLETRAKRSNSLKKHWDGNPERKKKQSVLMSGENNPFFNKHHDIDILNFISICNTGSSPSEETRKKLSESSKKAWAEGKHDGKTTKGHIMPLSVREAFNKVNRIAILQYNKDGDFIKEWTSIKEACEDIKISFPTVKKSLKKGIAVKGFIFKYKII